MDKERSITAREVTARMALDEELRRVQLGPSYRPPVTLHELTHAEQPRFERRYGAARAYRGGVVVCGRVDLTVRQDTRIGLAPRERRYFAARFLDHLHPALRAELAELARRRGAAARRAAERIEPIEFVVADPDLGPQRIMALLEPPQLRRGALRDIEFGLRQPTP